MISALKNAGMDMSSKSNQNSSQYCFEDSEACLQIGRQAHQVESGELPSR